MNVVWAVLVVVAVTAAAVTAMLLTRRRAPDGGYFNDGDRAAGVFGVLATGFSVLLGFIIFLAFESYDTSRSGAELEALTVAQQIETAQLLPAEVGPSLTGELICYARSVIHTEWPQMIDHSIGESINPWGVQLFGTVEGVELTTANEEAGYGKWLDQTETREQARQSRIHGSSGVIPPQLWITLFFISAIIIVYLLFFADSGERALVQGMLMGSLVAAIVAMLLVLHALDDPFHRGYGGLQPTAMERTLRIIDQQLAVVGQDLTVPCDESGIPL